VPKRSNVRLTKRVAEAAQPETMTFDSDVTGFGLRVTRGGSRSFIIQFRTRTGRQRKLTLGHFPDLTVDQARDQARIELGRVAQGMDPSAERAELRQSWSVRDLADHYCNEYATSRNLKPRTVKDARHLLDRFAIPRIGSRKVSEVEPSSIRRLHGEAQRAAGPYQANRLLATLRRMFALAVEGGQRATNPSKGITKFPEEERWRDLSEDEVGRLLRACDSYHNQNAANAVRMLLFTGARLNEVLKADWQQFDLDREVWLKPSAHTKTKRQHRIELSGPLLDMLREMRRDDPDGHYLFPGKDRTPDPKRPGEDARRPRSDLQKPWDWLTRRASLSDVRIHDLRRTAAGFMLDDGESLSVIGSALGHTQLSTTTRYARLRNDAQRRGLESAARRMVRAKGSNTRTRLA